MPAVQERGYLSSRLAYLSSRLCEFHDRCFTHVHTPSSVCANSRCAVRWDVVSRRWLRRASVEKAFSAILFVTMRKLKHHEQKLLKKVDFLTWKQEDNLREIKILRRYHIQDRDDYVKCVQRIAFSTPESGRG